MSTLLPRTPVLVFIIIVLALACAEVAPPPGGEKDETGPYLIGSEPPAGAVKVGPGDRVTLYFSERIKKPTTGEVIFISPRPAGEPKIKWGADKVTVVLPDSFTDNQTYIVSAGVGIKDLRGNQLDSTLTVAFSTGAALANGRTSGRIVDDKGKPVNGLMVALYEPVAIEPGRPLDSADAHYLTQTNAEGTFTIGYLPEQRYSLIAFRDQVPNGRFNPGREPFAVPDRSIRIGGRAPLEDLMLTLVVRDTVPPQLLSAAYGADGMLRLRLSKPVNAEYLALNPQGCLLTPLDSGLVRPALALMESVDEPLDQLTFYSGPLPEGEYHLALTYDAAHPPLTYEAVEVAAQEDDNPPRLLRFRPDQEPRFADEIEIELSFSEPLDSSVITSETFLLFKEADSAVGVTMKRHDPLRLLLVPDTVEAGEKYRLELTEFELADLAGNRLGDSLRQFTFQTIDPDSLGSISGSTAVAIDGKENDSVLLTFGRVGGGRAFDLSVPPGDFRIDVPAGKYLLSGFVDSDGDGRKGNGSVTPYVLSETMAVFPDTITVRARFETAGIQFEFR